MLSHRFFRESVVKAAKMKARVYIILSIVLAVIACQKDQGRDLENYLFYKPDDFPQPEFEIADVENAKAIFELGRDLFYDPILSRDNTVSCGTCHKPFAAMADLDHQFSHGIDNQFGERNAPGIFNLAWHKGFMHDGGVNHIELISFAPMTNPIEMDEELPNVLEKLRNDSDYSKRFKGIFGREVASNDVFDAFTRFMGLMISDNSKYDQWKQAENNVVLDEEELKGLDVFLDKCESCHKQPLFSDFEYRDIGLDANPEDPGRGEITNKATDHGKFKTPSLRNVAITAPYMHDGRYRTLKQVLDFKSSGVQQSPNLDPDLIREDGLGIVLSEEEKAQLIAFMNSLTDYSFTQDKRFHEP